MYMNTSMILILLLILEDDNKIEELNEKRTILAAFCKLIAFNIFDMKLAAPIFAQLIRVSPKES